MPGYFIQWFQFYYTVLVSLLRCLLLFSLVRSLYHCLRKETLLSKTVTELMIHISTHAIRKKWIHKWRPIFHTIYCDYTYHTPWRKVQFFQVMVIEIYILVWAHLNTHCGRKVDHLHYCIMCPQKDYIITLL